MSDLNTCCSKKDCPNGSDSTIARCPVLMPFGGRITAHVRAGNGGKPPVPHGETKDLLRHGLGLQPSSAFE